MVLRLKLTLFIVIVCTIVFFPQSITHNIFDWNLFAFTPSLALERPWTFVTSIFLHASFTHLFFNMFIFIMFGMVLESRVGPKHFLIIFFLSGIVGSLGYMITASNSSIPAIGASGAIYGVMGSLAVLMPFAMVWVFGFFPMPMIFAAIFWVVAEFSGLFSPSDIAHGAHLGGLFIGFLYGFYLRKQENKRKPKEYKLEISGYADWEK